MEKRFVWFQGAENMGSLGILRFLFRWWKDLSLMGLSHY